MNHANRLASPHDEARAFWRMRRRLLANAVRRGLETARLRVSLVVLLSGVFWYSLFRLFVEGFQFLQTAVPHPQTRALVTGRLFELFFFAVLVMLVFSCAIILYGGLYRSREVRLLLTLPVRAQRVFGHKFQEAMLFASWGSMLLGTPMLVAYGLAAGAPWPYYAVLLPGLVAFVHIPGAAGAVLCLGVVRFLPRRRAGALLLLGLAATAAIGWWGRSLLVGPTSDLLTPDWFREVLGRIEFSDHRLLPSWWLSACLLETAEGTWSDGTMFLCLTAANALVAYQLAAWFAGRVYRRSYSGLFDRRPAARGRWLTWLDRAVARGAVPLPRTLRLLMINDLRVFRRDPVQWSQFLIFFGLLALYFLNVRRLSYDLDSVAWVNMVSFLNLGVVGLLLSTFTTRFIFPMTSLEGRRFWVLGRLPIPRDTFLWSKFAFAALGSLAACMPLVIISDVMLGVWSFVLGVHLAACAMFCLGLSGIAVGLGARVPNFKEESPSKIAAGFGGTLNLVLGTLYVIAVAALVGVPCHFFAVGRQIGPWTLEGYRWLGAPGTMWLGAAAGLALCLAATLVPLRLGLAAFRRQEF